MQVYNSLATIPNQIVSLYDLTDKEQELVMLWRSIETEGVVVEFTVQNNTPDVVKINYDNYFQEKEAIDYDLLPDEEGIIKVIRSMGYGKVVMYVSEGIPRWLNGDTYKQVKLGFNKPIDKIKNSATIKKLATLENNSAT